MRSNTSSRPTDVRDYFSGAKVTSQVATPGAKSAVYDCLVKLSKKQVATEMVATARIAAPPRDAPAACY